MKNDIDLVWSLDAGEKNFQIFVGSKVARPFGTPRRARSEKKFNFVAGVSESVAEFNRQFAARIICQSADPIDRFAARSTRDDNSHSAIKSEGRKNARGMGES